MTKQLILKGNRVSLSYWLVPMEDHPVHHYPLSAAVISRSRLAGLSGTTRTNICDAIAIVRRSPDYGWIAHGQS